MNRDRENQYTLAIMMDFDQAYMAYKTDTISNHLFDLTGGYGHLAIPLIMSWLSGEDQWLIGHEAEVTEEGQGIIIRDLLRGLVANASIDLGQQAMTYAQLFVKFIGLMAEALRHVNPKCVVEAIYITMPSLDKSMELDLLDRLKPLALKEVAIVEATLAGTAWALDQGQWQKAIWVNYNRQGLQAYLLSQDHEVQVVKVLEIKDMAIERLEHDLYQMINEAYLEQGGLSHLSESQDQMIGQMVQTYLAHVFLKEGQGQGLKLTFNQVFPPFQKVLAHEQLASLVQASYTGMEQGLNYIKHSYKGYEWFFTGEGFRLPWAKKEINALDQQKLKVQWQGQLYGLLALDQLDTLVQTGDRAIGDIGILLGPVDQERFHTMIPGAEGVLGYCHKVALIVEQGQRSLKIVKKTGDKTYDLVKELPLDTYLQDKINLIGLTVQCHGLDTIDVTLKSLTL